MFGLTLRPGARYRLASLLLALLAVSTSFRHKGLLLPKAKVGARYIPPQPVAVKVSVRDMRGNPLDAAANVHLHSTVKNFDMQSAYARRFDCGVPQRHARRL